MLHLGLSVDVKCPHHPLRKYPHVDSRCPICAGLTAAADAATQIERYLKGADRIGADVRWKNFRRRARPQPPGPAFQTE